MKPFLPLALVLLLSSCQSAYYAAWEKVGVEKRDILVDRVESAKDSQQQAQQQFSSALEQLSQLINFNGGELQDVYESLKDELDASEKSAENVTARIDKVESVAEALFSEKVKFSLQEVKAPAHPSPTVLLEVSQMLHEVQRTLTF